MTSANGFTDVLWFMGIVEDNQDPTNAGRVRVRCFGIHPPVSSNEVETEDLPWSVPINGSYGASSQIPKVSDWVFGFFIDGRDAQHPMLLGTVPGQHSQMFYGSGYSDTYIRPSEEAAEEYGKPPLHPAQSGEEMETTQLVLQNAVSQNEPGVPVGTNPKSNVVWKSRYGDSYLQVDGAKDSEHILLSHASGSHILINQNGDVKIKSFGDMYISSEGNTYDKDSGSRRIEVDGTYNIISKNATIEVEGDLNHTVKGNYNLNVGGKIGIVSGQSIDMACQRMSLNAVSEHININAAEKIKVEAGNAISLKSGSDTYITSDGILSQYSAGSMFLNTESEFHNNSGSGNYTSAGGDLYMTAGGIIAGDASEVYLNSGQSTAATGGEKTSETPKTAELPAPVTQAPSNEGNEVTNGKLIGKGGGGGGAGFVDDAAEG